MYVFAPRRFAWLLILLTAGMINYLVAAEERPNLLLIFVDDMGYGDLGCYGGSVIKTPNIDALASEGIRCTDGYVTASVCGPSRLGLLSGAYQQRFGVYWNEDLWEMYGLEIPANHKLLPETLGAAGYVTGHVGKWNISPEPRDYVDEAFAVMNWKGAYYPDAEGRYLGVDGPDFRMEPHGWGPAREGDEYLTDRLTRHAIDFMQRHAKEPFFLYLAYNAPHTPLQADRKYKSMFPDQDEPNQLYAGMVSSLDENIGRVLNKLEQLGLKENTLVAFASDNGPARGAPYLRGWHEDWPEETLLGSAGPLAGHKAQRNEGGIRIPFILRWPKRLPAGQVYRQPVSTMDLYPTFCAAVAATVPPSTRLDGVDLLPYVSGQQEGSPHETLFWKPKAGGAVRWGPWKLIIQSWGNGHRSLYNLATDLGESQDVAREHPEITERLAKAWQNQFAHMPPAISGDR